MGKPGQEDSLINAFTKKFQDKARQQEKEVLSIALNGQDRHVLADYFLCDEAKWTLVEFKSWAESGQVAEALKDKSVAVCQALEKDQGMKLVHDACHFAGFGVGAGLGFKVYRKHFCISIGEAGTDAQFLASFFEGRIGVCPDAADAYLRWLISIGEGGKSRSLRLLIDTGHESVLMKPFASAADVSNWITDLRQLRDAPPPPPPPPHFKF